MTEFNPLRDFKSHLRRVSACEEHPPLERCTSVEAADAWYGIIQFCAPAARREHLRWFALNDLYFLLVFILHRWPAIGELVAPPEYETKEEREARLAKRDWRKARWCCQRANEYQDDPWNWLDLWSREHFKSEIITIAGNIQSLLKNPNETIGIFSHTRPIAKGFLREIMTEFAQNDELKMLFDDVLYADPAKQAPHWGEDVGLWVKRTDNRKEGSIEAWGLIDGQPVSKRFSILSFDDVVSRKEITELMIPRATEEFRTSLLLTASDPVRFRYAATYQEIGDTSQQLIEAGFRVRLRPGFNDSGAPLCLSDEKAAFFKQSLSPKSFALQLLLDPKKAKGEEQLGFNSDWLTYYDRSDVNLGSLNKYILVDPAGDSKLTKSYFALAVVGLSPDGRYKILDAVLDKVNLDQRTAILKERVIQYRPLRIFYEKQAMQADIEHIRGEMRRELWEAEILEVGTNQATKDKRIEGLIPAFAAKLVQLPKEGIPYRMHDGTVLDVVKLFIEREYVRWPFGEYKDLLDALSWIKFEGVAKFMLWPRRYGDASTQTGAFGETFDGSGGSWMVG